VVQSSLEHCRFALGIIGIIDSRVSLRSATPLRLGVPRLLHGCLARRMVLNDAPLAIEFLPYQRKIAADGLGARQEPSTEHQCISGDGGIDGFGLGSLGGGSVRGGRKFGGSPGWGKPFSGCGGAGMSGVGLLGGESGSSSGISDCAMARHVEEPSLTSS